MIKIASIREIGTRLRAARESKGLDAKEVAIQLDVVASTYSRWEDAAGEGGCREVCRAGAFLGLTPNLLLLETPSQYPRDQLSDDDVEALTYLVLEVTKLHRYTLAADVSAIRVLADFVARFNATLNPSKPIGTVTHYEGNTRILDAPEVAAKMQKAGTPKPRKGGASLAGEAPAKYGKAKRDAAVKALIDRVERSDGDVDTPAVGAPLAGSGAESPSAPETAQPEPAPTPDSSTFGHKPHRTPSKARKKREK